jgi:CRP-like cAMP-binding protein
VKDLEDRRGYADLLERIPAFTMCTRSVLEEYLAHGAVEETCPAGEMLKRESDRDFNLYVMVSGSALLDAGDSIITSLEAGDFFGGIPARHLRLVTSVVAVTEVKVLVLHPSELERLAELSAMDQHPSKINWRDRLGTTERTSARHHRRLRVLVGQSS